MTFQCGDLSCRIGQLLYSGGELRAYTFKLETEE